MESLDDLQIDVKGPGWGEQAVQGEQQKNMSRKQFDRERWRINRLKPAFLMKEAERMRKYRATKMADKSKLNEYITKRAAHDKARYTKKKAEKQAQQKQSYQ